MFDHPAAIRPFRLSALVLALTLAGCTSFMAPAPSGPARSIDYRNDDIASLVLAFDLPAGIQPVPEETNLKIDFTVPGAAPKAVTARLAFADAEGLTGALPAPANGRAYYFLAITDADQASLREAQAWVRAGNGTAGVGMPLTLTAHFCTTGEGTPSQPTYSVLPLVGGTGGYGPLLANANVLTSMSQPAVPPC